MVRTFQALLAGATHDCREKRGRNCRSHGYAGSFGRPGSLEPVEDQVEPEVNSFSVVVAGLEYVLDSYLGYYGYSSAGTGDGCRRYFDGLVRRLERQTRCCSASHRGSCPGRNNAWRPERWRNQLAVTSRAHRVVLQRSAGPGRASQLHSARSPTDVAVRPPSRHRPWRMAVFQ